MAEKENGMKVDAVNVGLGLALTSDGKTIPIVDHLDVSGDFCEKSDAVYIVAGPDADGRWWNIVLEECESQSH